MINRAARERLLASTIIAGMFLAAPAFAQDTGNSAIQAGTPAPGQSEPSAGPAVSQLPETAQASSAPEGTGEIVVTGSRLRQPNLASAAPITVLNSQEVKLQGTTRVEDLLNSLPQVFAGQGGNISNGSSGTATLNLRGLGDVRTLVLVNGRRLMPGDPQSPAPDINFIPGALIKRVDVLTGGASTVYGSDAVAGVVNFVLDDQFDGFKVDGLYSLYQHDNHASAAVGAALDARGFPNPRGGSDVSGQNIDTTVEFGTHFADNRGHITAYFGYRHTNPVTQDSRDYSACSLAGGPDTFSCGGSSTSATGRFLFPTTGQSYTVQGNQFRTYRATDAYNYAPTNYYQRNDERYTAGAFADYEVTPAFHPYLEAMFMDDRTNAQIAPSGDFGNDGVYISCDNPLASAQQQGILCAPGRTVDSAGNALTTSRTGGGTVALSGYELLRRNVEGGPRDADLRHTDFRTVVGTKGQIAEGITYDAYYQYSRVNFNEIYRNEFSATRLKRALNVTTNPANGQPVCESVLDGTDTACVPYNVFTNGGVNAAQLAYLQVPGIINGRNTEQVANGSITADLGHYGVKSPFASDGLSFNVGIEYRKETINLQPDLEFITNDLTGQGSATLPINGAFNVREEFTEAQLPLVQDKPFFHLLSLDGGYRRSHYEVDGGAKFNTNTFKGEVIWAPARDISFRGSYNRAVRAPNTNELFTNSHVALDGASDPCAVANPGVDTPTATLAQCERTGVTAAQYGNIISNSAAQYNGLVGGNTNLSPEKSDSYTVGVVLTPTFLRGFSLTVDAFRINLKNRIGVIGADTILNACINSNQFCGNIHRDGSGSLWLTQNGYVVDTNLNAGGFKTQGIDVNTAYSRSLGRFGQVSLSLIGTYLDKLTTSNVGIAAYNCAGYFGLNCGTPNPTWRHKARVTFTLPMGLGLSGQWRYFSKVKLDQTSDNSFLNVPGAAAYTIKSQSYFDLTLTAQAGDHLQLRLGINNLLDKDPPIVGSQVLSGVVGNGNTFPQVYDALGRYIYVGATVTF